jgi:hypothetical protein
MASQALSSDLVVTGVAVIAHRQLPQSTRIKIQFELVLS